MRILKLLSALYYLGMALLVIAVITLIAKISIAKWIFVAALVPIVGVRLYNRIVCVPERKRINSILFISSLFLVVAAFLIFENRNYWIVAALITAVLDFYVSFRKIK